MIATDPVSLPHQIGSWQVGTIETIPEAFPLQIPPILVINGGNEAAVTNRGNCARTVMHSPRSPHPTTEDNTVSPPFFRNQTDKLWDSNSNCCQRRRNIRPWLCATP